MVRKDKKGLQWSVPLSSITKFEVREESRWFETEQDIGAAGGALIGATIGLSVGLFVGGVAEDDCYGGGLFGGRTVDDFCLLEKRLRTFAISSITGAITGAIIGAAMSPNWESVSLPLQVGFSPHGRMRVALHLEFGR